MRDHRHGEEKDERHVRLTDGHDADAVRGFRESSGMDGFPDGMERQMMLYEIIVRFLTIFLTIQNDAINQNEP